MPFWWQILLSCLIVPFTMLIAGWMMRKHCPENRNRILGYRTNRSMKNEDTWKFANMYCGRLWLQLGFVLLILSALIFVPIYHYNENVTEEIAGILTGIQCLILILSILPTECALKKTFNDDGTYR